MQKSKWVLWSMLLLPGLVFAAEFHGGEYVSLGFAEYITDDVYLGGGSVTSAGIVTGDVVAGGGQVLVSGDVSGDVIAAGGNVTILSMVGDDLRAGGGTVLVQSRIGGDAIIGGGQVTLGGEGVGGDVIIGGGVVQIDAPVAGSMRIGGGEVYINAPIAGDVIVTADTLTLARGAVISGNLSYRATKKLIQEDGSKVLGHVDFQEQRRKDTSRAVIGTLVTIAMIAKFFMLLLSSLVVGLSFRRFSKKCIDTAEANPFSQLGRGLLIFVVTPILSVILLVTFIGMPFGVMGLLGFVILFLAAWMITPMLVGSMFFRFILKKETEVSWQTIFVGALAFSILGLVPVAGWILQAILVLISLGALFTCKWEVAKEWR